MKIERFPLYNEAMYKDKFYYYTFNYNDEKINLESTSVQGIFKKGVDFLYNNGYKFDESFKSRRLLNLNEIPKSYKPESSSQNVYKIPGTDKYILCNFGPVQLIRNLNKMLKRFGIDENSIVSNIHEMIVPNHIQKGTSSVESGDDPDDSEFRTERPKAFDYPDDSSVMDFKHFRGIQAQPESKLEEPVKNPFGGTKNSAAICVLGESGAGKSTTIEKILRKENHVFEFIIPTAATTGLLSQFSPSKGSSGGYILSRLGRMLIDASGNPNKFYTAVFDECHKAQTIDMINDELLQAISKKRNRGNRFISLDDDTAELYRGKLKPDRGNLLIPDNFGFIFISSKPDIIANNDDFLNRVDLINLKSYKEETIDSIPKLMSVKTDR
jgi:hypothetical protein